MNKIFCILFFFGIVTAHAQNPDAHIYDYASVAEMMNRTALPNSRVSVNVQDIKSGYFSLVPLNGKTADSVIIYPSPLIGYGYFRDHSQAPYIEAVWIGVSPDSSSAKNTARIQWMINAGYHHIHVDPDAPFDMTALANIDDQSTFVVSMYDAVNQYSDRDEINARRLGMRVKVAEANDTVFVLTDGYSNANWVADFNYKYCALNDTFANLIHKVGDEGITGIKTFSTQPEFQQGVFISGAKTLAFGIGNAGNSFFATSSQITNYAKGQIKADSAAGLFKIYTEHNGSGQNLGIDLNAPASQGTPHVQLNTTGTGAKINLDVDNTSNASIMVRSRATFTSGTIVQRQFQQSDSIQQSAIGGYAIINAMAHEGTLGSGQHFLFRGSVTHYTGTTTNDSTNVFTVDNTGSIVANGTLQVGTGTQVATAISNFISTTKGFLFPRMTTAQRTAIPLDGTNDGLMVYDITLHKLFLNENGTWVQK